jgi:hypothetical protein
MKRGRRSGEIDDGPRPNSGRGGPAQAFGLKRAGFATLA